MNINTTTKRYTTKKNTKSIKRNITQKYTTDVKRNVWTYYNSKRINIIIELLTTKVNFKSGLSCNTELSFYTDNGMDKEELIDNKEFLIDLDEECTYTLFGGMVYNILYKNIAKIDLNNFVDHTSDIDILINPPIFSNNYNENINNHIRKLQELKGIKDIYCIANIFVDNNGKKKLNSFYEIYSSQIYNELLQKLNSENIDMSNTVKFDLNEYDEYTSNREASKNVFLHNEIGNAHLIRFFYVDMLKIQFVLKIQDDNETIIDHLFEIVFTLHDTEYHHNYNKPIQREKLFDTINVSLDNNINTDINIQTIKDLIDHNFQAYMFRKQLFEDKYHHKPINHVGRLLYLLFLFKNMRNNDYVINNINNFCIYFMQQIGKITYNMRKDKIDVLKYYVKKTDGYDIIDIKIIDIIKAFIDVFYNISSDGFMTKRVQSMTDVYRFNNKNINDVFRDDVYLKQYKFGENEPFINSQYNHINNIINKNTVRVNKNLIAEFKEKYITEFKEKHGKTIKIPKYMSIVKSKMFKTKPKTMSKSIPKYMSFSSSKKNKSKISKKPYNSI